jgi:hypothetical protein
MEQGIQILATYFANIHFALKLPQSFQLVWSQYSFLENAHLLVPIWFFSIRGSLCWKSIETAAGMMSNLLPLLVQLLK